MHFLRHPQLLDKHDMPVVCYCLCCPTLPFAPCPPRCRWMQQQAYSRACPVCKAGVEIDKVVPIYGRGSEPAAAVQEVVKPVPPRPAGQRPAPTQVQSREARGHAGMAAASALLGSNETILLHCSLLAVAVFCRRRRRTRRSRAAFPRCSAST
jgi:hypothetical protein